MTRIIEEDGRAEFRGQIITRNDDRDFEPIRELSGKVELDLD